MGMSYAEAKHYGLGHLHPAEAGVKALPPEIAAMLSPKNRHPVPSKAPDDGLNKLERAFYEAATEAAKGGAIRRVRVHPIKLKVIGPKLYIPDFLIDEIHDDVWTIHETKGFMREDAELKLLAAAEHYPMFRWVLTQRIKRRWQCQHVTARGISREIWCPGWLR